MIRGSELMKQPAMICPHSTSRCVPNKRAIFSDTVYISSLLTEIRGHMKSFQMSMNTIIPTTRSPDLTMGITIDQ